MSMIQSLGNYFQGGAQMMGGAFPVMGRHGGAIVTAQGERVFTMGPHYYVQEARTGIAPGAMRLTTAEKILVQQADGSTMALSQTKGFSPMGKMAWAWPGLAVGISAMFMYQGYQDNGARGMFDAALLDVSANAAILQGASHIKSVAGGTSTHRPRTWGTLGMFGRSPVLAMVGMGMASYTMGQVGNEVAGPIGTVAGAWLGAFAGRSPLRLAAAALAYGGAKIVGRGTYQLLKSGYRKRSQMRGLDTAGDTAAFSTRQAVTMRQRAVQAIHKSHTNARSALGMEASFMHTNKNYFGTYRRMGNMM